MRAGRQALRWEWCGMGGVGGGGAGGGGKFCLFNCVVNESEWMTGGSHGHVSCSANVQSFD